MNSFNIPFADFNIWSITAIESIELAIRIIYLENHDYYVEILSGQERISCVPRKYGDGNCMSFSITYRFNYAIENGIALSSEYSVANSNM